MNSDLSRWQQTNDDYLAAALKWLRLRLGHDPAPEITAIVPVPASITESKTKNSLFGFFERRPGPANASAATAGPTNSKGVSELAAAATRMEELAATDPPPALLLLSRRFGLSRFEQEVLLLCAAMDLDTRIPALCAQADPNRPYPTFALALTLFDEPAWDALSPERPLRQWHLLEIHQPGNQPLTTSPLRADERIVHYLKGLNYLDDRLTPLLAPFDAPYSEVDLPPSQQQAVDLIVRHLQHAATLGPPPVIQLAGLDSLSKQMVARHAAARLGLHLDRLPAESLPSQAEDLETLARLWQRESILLPLALYFDAHEPGNPAQPDGKAAQLRRFLARNEGFFFLSSREVQVGLEPTTVTVEVDKPTPAEQQAAWAEGLGDTETNGPALLAGQFNLNVATIRHIAHIATAEAAENGATPHDRAWATCLDATRPQMDLLAQRLDPRATWDDIVLSTETEGLLHQIADQVRQRSRVYDTWGFRQKMNRGLGINTLFGGESGTGKTMAAEVMARDLNLSLYRIDLSAVVSKYIGETEKNLRRLFDAAEDGGAILFFDEADALFGKRSQVKDSHDRYANIEINYLLQRMEAYRGLAILATNMKSALDQAFLRRLRFIVNFPFPGPKERKLIWQKVFPAETPQVDLDFEHLARLNLTGGSIHNIALNAAFLAAQAGTAVTMPLVLAAARTEFRKLERPVREADFRWQEPVVSSQ